MSALHVQAGMQRQASFLCWLSRTLQASLYPGAPFERKYFALIVLNQLLDAWGTTDHTPPPRGSKGKPRGDGSANFESTYAGLQVFCPGFLGTLGVTSLLGGQPSKIVFMGIQKMLRALKCRICMAMLQTGHRCRSECKLYLQRLGTSVIRAISPRSAV